MPPKPTWYEIAVAETGTKEVPGSGDNPRIVEYHAVTAGGASPDEVPWCASAACFCLEQAGIRSPRSKRARDFLHWGVELDGPRVGAIAVLRRGNNPAQAHVGFVAWWDTSQIAIRGGNQHDAFDVATFPRVRVLSYRWPSEIGVPIAAVLAEGPMNNSKTTYAGYATALSAVAALAASYLGGHMDLSTAILGGISALAVAFGFKVAADATPTKP